MSDHWINIIDEAGDYSRQECLHRKVFFKYNMYWFKVLYFRIFKYPGYLVYIINGLIVSNYKYYMAGRRQKLK